MGNPPLRRLLLQDLHLCQLRSPRLRRQHRRQLPRRRRRLPHHIPPKRPHRTRWGRVFSSPIAVSMLGALTTRWIGALLWGKQERAQRPSATLLLWPRRRRQLSNPHRVQVRSLLRRLGQPSRRRLLLSQHQPRRPRRRQHRPSAALVDPTPPSALPPALRAGGAGRANPLARVAVGAGAAALHRRLQHQHQHLC